MAASTTLTGDAGLMGATALAVPSVSSTERQDVACVSGNPILLESFNQWIAWAFDDLADLPSAKVSPVVRSIKIKNTRRTLTHALERANQIGCPARKAMCFRVLNWLNAEIRRLPA